MYSGQETKQIIQKASVSQMISSVEIPRLPPLYLDNNYHITEVDSTIPEVEEEYIEKGKVITVPIGILPEDYDKFEVKYPGIDYEPDTFQKQALYYMIREENIFVTAHTSSGKTLIAEFAAYIATLHNTKMIYTSPIKALSNQKYREFSNKFESVGILTGDAQINSGAKCMIMTTEILRNMLYRGTDLLNDVEYIVFDEIHYIGDRERGVVWEEVIIMVPKHIVLIFLSATSPNAKDMSEWISTVKENDIYLISTHQRAVELEHGIYFREYLYTLTEKGIFNQNEYLRAKKTEKQESFKEKQKIQTNTPNKPLPYVKKKSTSTLGTPIHLIRKLVDLKMTPVVFFDFSKSRIESSFHLSKQIDLTTTEEKKLISDFINSALQKIPKMDRELPQIQFILPGLLKGIGVHHATLLPILKEIIEILFTTGALRVLFATETMAMGLNMPTRTVVFRTIKKYNTDSQVCEYINTNEYTQMAGRAGRRGYDTIGTAIIEVPGEEILPDTILKKLHTGQPHKIESKFYITPRMLLKLLRVKVLSIEEMVQLSFGNSRTAKKIKGLYKRQKDLRALQTITSTTLDSCPNCGEEISILTKKYKETQELFTALYTKVLALSPEKLIQQTLLTTNGYILEVSSIRKEPETILITENTKRILSHTTHKTYKQSFTTISRIRYSQDTMTSLDKEYNRSVNQKESEQFEISPEKILFILDQTGNPLELPLDNKVLLQEQKEAITSWNNLGTVKCTNCQEYLPHYLKYLEEHTIRRALDRIESILSIDHKQSLSENNCINYLEYLQKSEYIDNQKNIKIKGRLACEFNSIDCILATEIILSPTITAIPPAHLMISSLALTFHEKYQLEEDTEEGKEPRTIRLRELQQAIDTIESIFQEIQPQLDKYNIKYHRPNYACSAEILMWLEGLSLAEIVQSSPLPEGVIVKYIKKTTEICTEFSMAFKLIGNHTLSQEIEQVADTLRRGIIFTPSLYYG
ncbi:antiviral helicase SKI2 [Nematocida sp. AWRm80]|nr:antiviral helicase SKI2 [Nematocida sp. AWRm80]